MTRWNSPIGNYSLSAPWHARPGACTTRPGRRISGWILSLGLLVTGLTAHAQAPTPKLRTYIVAGQSNAEGFGIRNYAASKKNTTDQDRYINSILPKQDLHSIGFGHWDAAFDRAVIYKANASNGVAPAWDFLDARQGYWYDQNVHDNNMFGPELAIGRELSTHLKESIGIIKYSVGGTGISLWNPDNPDRDLYDNLLDAVANATAPMAAGGLELDIQGVFWMQGETDSTDPQWTANYEANLRRLIAGLRRDLNKPQLDVYISTIKDTPLWTYRQGIWNAQQAVADADANVYLVKGRDLETHINDYGHYNARGQVTLGQRFALQALFDAWGLGQVAW